MGLFSPQASPIAIDFGTSSIKLLQISDGERPKITAAAQLPIPVSARTNLEAAIAFHAEYLPKMLADGQFKSKRAVISIPAAQTLVQHMQLPNMPTASRDDLVMGQLHHQMGCAPGSVVVRTYDVGEVHRGGQVQTEIICVAMARNTVMRYIDLLKRCKLTVVGVHPAAVAIARAFGHLNRRESDAELTTLYVDLGWGGTHVAISHGTRLVFGRQIQLGGREFDRRIAETLHCNAAEAQVHRLAMNASIASVATDNTSETGEPSEGRLKAAADAHESGKQQKQLGGTVAVEEDRRDSLHPAASCYLIPEGIPSPRAANVDLTELLDTMCDELSMCLRYHEGLFPGRVIDRAIFLGGEARQVWLCQHLARTLRVPGQLGDPLSRLTHDRQLKTPGLNLGEPQPGWAVANGLCTAPTDL
jgi:Tfp pilus assembly PilM family ATPase